MNPSGPFSRGVQKGAAYVYRRSATTGLWYEETKLFLDDGVGTDRYGWQVCAFPSCFVRCIVHGTVLEPLPLAQWVALKFGTSKKLKLGEESEKGNLSSYVRTRWNSLTSLSLSHTAITL